MNIKESVLEFLYKNNNDRQTNLYSILLPFDSDRLDVKSTLFNLEKDKLIEIDKDYNKLTFKSGGVHIPLNKIDLFAKLTINGEKYCKELFENEKQPLQQNIIINSSFNHLSHSSISSQNSTVNTDPNAHATNIIMKVLIGIFVTVVGGLILYYIFKIH